MAPTQHRALTGPFETFYHQCGDASAAPVILLHGSGPGANAMSNWVHALPYLGERYRAVAPDLAGFGESTHPQPPRGAAQWIEVWTAQVIALLDALEIPQAHLVGNSMGGGVTLQLLRKHPQRFSRIVLMGAVGSPHTATPGLQRGWGYYRTGTQEELAYLVGKFLHNPAVLGADIEAIAKQRHALVMQDRIRTQFEAMFPGDAQQHVDAFVVPEHELRAMQHPMLVTHGREDFFIPVSTSEYVAQRVPNAQLHVFHHCGHWIQIEQRNAFNRLVRDFLDGAFD